MILFYKSRILLGVPEVSAPCEDFQSHPPFGRFKTTTPQPLLFLSWAPFDFLTCAPSDFGGKTRQAFPAPSHPSSSNIFHLGNHIFFHSQIIKLLTWGQTGEVPSPMVPPPCCPASRASPPWTKVFHIKDSIDYKACCHVCHLVAGLGTTGSGTGSSTSPSQSSQQSS